MGVFDNAKMVKINNKEVESIKTSNGATIYQRPMIATIIGDEIYLGHDNSQWLIANGDVKVDFGTGRQYTINTTKQMYFGYTNQGDGLSSHDITFFGIITGLGDSCFEDCTSLTNITIPLSVTSLGESCFDSCTNLTSVTIPNGVTSLENFCFYGCSSLTSIIIPNSITSLGESCFYGCTGLTSITIPNSVTSLGTRCFQNCIGLTSVTIPNSVTSLGNRCFQGCTSLINYQLYWTNNNIITYDSDKMPNNTNTKFYVPKGQKTNYVNKGYPSDKVVERSS